MTVYPWFLLCKNCCNIFICSDIHQMNTQCCVSLHVCQYQASSWGSCVEGWWDSLFNKVTSTVWAETLSFLWLSWMQCGLMQSCIFLSFLCLWSIASRRVQSFTLSAQGCFKQNKALAMSFMSIYLDFSKLKKKNLMVWVETCFFSKRTYIDRAYGYSWGTSGCITFFWPQNLYMLCMTS